MLGKTAVRYRLAGLVGALSVSLVGCSALSSKRAIDDSTTENITDSLREIHAELSTEPQLPPQDVLDALAQPSLEFAGQPAEETFDLVVEGMEASQFFPALVKNSNYSIVLHPEVKGAVTLELNDITVPQAMDVVKEVYGYPYKRRGNLFTVQPADLQTEVFKIDYIDIKREGISQTRVASGSVSDVSGSNTSNSNSSNNVDDSNQQGSTRNGSVVGTYIQTQGESDFWGELTSNLELLIGTGDNRKVVVTPQSGMVIVRAMPNEVDLVREYLQSAELIMRRQVILEAKILEVTLSDQFQSGINWSAIGEDDGKTTLVAQGSGTQLLQNGTVNAIFPGGTGIGDQGSVNGIFGVSLNLKDFTGIIDLLEQQGTVQVLSSPRISTVNNQKAVIKVGVDQFFVTEVTNTVTSGDNPVSTPSVELTPFFSGIALDVTPQISAANDVVLHVHPTISEVEEQNRTFSVANQNFSLPLAQSSIRESDSIIYAKSEQVVVIGGLIQSVSNDNDAAAPWISKIPVLGHAFKQRAQQGSKRELVILIKPRVMDRQVAAETVESSLRRFEGMHKEMNNR